MVKFLLLILTAVALVQTVQSGCTGGRCGNVTCIRKGFREHTCTCSDWGTKWYNVDCYPGHHFGPPTVCNPGDHSYLCHCVHRFECGFPAGEFMIKHEASGLCVTGVRQWLFLDRCDPEGHTRWGRYQIFYTEGNYIKNKLYPERSMYVTQQSYYRQRKIKGEAAIGLVANGWLGNSGSNNKLWFEWEYEGRFLITMAPDRHKLVPVEVLDQLNQKWVSSPGTQYNMLGGIATEAVREEDEKRMKWLLVPI